MNLKASDSNGILPKASLRENPYPANKKEFAKMEMHLMEKK